MAHQIADFPGDQHTQGWLVTVQGEDREVYVARVFDTAEHAATFVVDAAQDAWGQLDQDVMSEYCLTEPANLRQALRILNADGLEFWSVLQLGIV